MNELATKNEWNDLFVPKQESLDERQSFTARTVRLNKKTKSASYNIGFKGEFLPLDLPLKLTPVGLYRKYVLEKWNDDNKEYSYQTTEFPYEGWNEQITVLDKCGDEPIEIGHMPAGDFTDWCLSYDEKVQALRRGKPSFVRLFKNDKGEEELIKSFKPKYILYMADENLTIYRFELTGGENETIRHMFKQSYEVAYGELYRCSVEIGFDKKPIESKVGTYYPIKLDVVGEVQNGNDFFNAQVEIYKAIKGMQGAMHKLAVEKGNVAPEVPYEKIQKSYRTAEDVAIDNELERTAAELLKNQPPKKMENVLDTTSLEEITNMFDEDESPFPTKG